MSDWLIDKSALVRLGDSVDAQAWAERIERGLVRITTVTRLEVGYSAHSGRDARRAFAGAPLAAMPVEYLTPSIEDRAVEVQLLLVDQGRHRGPSVPDLIIAATAELAGLIVLHLDKDFALIGEVTGQVSSACASDLAQLATCVDVTHGLGEPGPGSRDGGATTLMTGHPNHWEQPSLTRRWNRSFVPTRARRCGVSGYAVSGFLTGCAGRTTRWNLGSGTH